MLRRLLLLLRITGRNRLDFFSPAAYPSFRPFSAAAVAVPQSKPPDCEALTVSYLVSSCGLSDEAARKASKRLRLRATQRPDAVLALLRERGFTEPQIATLVSRHPVILAAEPDKTLKPKLDFFARIGCTGPELAKLLSAADSNLLSVSLHKRLIPNFNLLKTVFATDRAVVVVLRRDPHVLHYNLRPFFLSNLEALRRHGVPGPSITKFAANYPRILAKRSDHFERDARVLKQMGFDPASYVFGTAMEAMSGSTWKRKLTLYKSLGWSEEETMSAFLRQPKCMCMSDEKIKRAMDFFIGKLGLHHSFLVMRPNLLLFSLEKRTIPRGTIWRILVSKGLLRNVSNVSLHTLLSSTEKKFLEKYLLKYVEEVPEIMQIYQGKRGLTGLLKNEADAGAKQEL